MDENEKREAARAKLLEVIKYLRHAVQEAAKTGTVQIGILSKDPEGGGRVVAQFEAGEFIEDVATVIGAPPYTEEDDLDARAVQFLDSLGLRRK